VRFGSARYSVPTRLIGHTVQLRNRGGRLLVVETPTGEIVADHPLVAPGEISVADAHYGGARPVPRRAVRPRTPAEKAFCALGPIAEAFVTGAAAAGHTRLGPELEQLAALEATHGREVLLAALERAVTFGRWRAADVRSILDAGAGTPPSPPGRGRPGAQATHGADQAAGRLRHRPIRGRCTVTAPTPALAPDLHAGLRRLKLAAMRTLAPELLLTAKTQRWAPEELLRTLVEAEICARDASNTRHRLKAAAFPVAKILEEFDIAASLIPRATFDYLASLEWITAHENLCLVGPAGTGKSHP